MKLARVTAVGFLLPIATLILVFFLLFVYPGWVTSLAAQGGPCGPVYAAHVAG